MVDRVDRLPMSRRLAFGPVLRCARVEETAFSRVNIPQREAYSLTRIILRKDNNAYTLARMILLINTEKERIHFQEDYPTEILRSVPDSNTHSLSGINLTRS